jgi:hypothetical protein
MDSEADEVERLTVLKQRLDRLTVAIKSPGTSPQLPKKSINVEKVTLAAIACSGSLGLMRASPETTQQIHNAASPEVRRSGTEGVQHDVNERSNKLRSQTQTTLKLSFRLPKVDTNESTPSVLPQVSKATPSLCRNNSGGLLLAPTVSPLKLAERSRSGISGDSPTSSPDSRRPLNTWRKRCDTDPGSIGTQSTGSDSTELRGHSGYYERKDTIADALMEWDYEKKAFVMSPR